MANDCKKVRLFHQTNWEAVASIVENGLYAKLNGCKEEDPYPPRRLAVYGSDEIQIRSIARSSQEGRVTDWSGASLDNTPVIEYEVCADEVMVGDLYRECGDDYLDTLVTYNEFLEETRGGWARGRYQEPEFFIPDDMENIPYQAVNAERQRKGLDPLDHPVSGMRSSKPRILPSQIKAIHRMKDFVFNHD